MDFNYPHKQLALFDAKEFSNPQLTLFDVEPFRTKSPPSRRKRRKRREAFPASKVQPIESLVQEVLLFS